MATVRKTDFEFVRRHCAATARELFDDFDRKRKGALLDVAREFYPLGVSGLAKGVEELADECPYDEEHRFLTTKPMDDLRKGAAGFHGNLTSPARRWFRLRTPSFAKDPANRMGDDARRRMLDRLTEAVEWTMSRGNVYASLYKVYEHTLCFGFACMLVTHDRERIVKARTLRVGTYAMGVDEDGQVCRVARRFSWTAEQILRAFGDKGAKDCVKEAAKRGDRKRRWTVYNLIEPNATGDMRAYDRMSRELGLDDNMVYRSVYWLADGNSSDPQDGVLEISGFTIKPIVAPRMDYELGDTYGRGRGMDGIDLARGAQSFKYDIVKISGDRAQPAVVASSEFKEEGLRLGRGQVNYARFGESRQAMVMPALANPPDANDTRLSFEETKEELADLFFNTAFATIDALKTQSGVKTATEIDALVRENMERLNPVVTNFDKELLDPLVSVVTKYTIQSGIVPMTEEDLASLGAVNIEYVSQIHLAAKQSQIGALTNWVSFVGSLAPVKPEIADNLDADGISDRYAEMLGVPAECVADDAKVEAVRSARAQQMAQQQRMAAMEAQASAAKGIGGVPVDDQHLGGKILQGLGGQ